MVACYLLLWALVVVACMCSNRTSCHNPAIGLDQCKAKAAPCEAELKTELQSVTMLYSPVE